MYFSQVSLKNWRSYGDVTFNFNTPSSEKPVVLIGGMNGHGKTSFLVALYLGLFGKYGLRYCEGFTRITEGDSLTYRKAIEAYRRESADPDEPTILDITLSPSSLDIGKDEEEVRVVRRWFFTSKNLAKPASSFEEIDVYISGKLIKRQDMDKDPILFAHERIEKCLFPAHVSPAFFFDGEQAQKLIENMGEAGIKKAVEVMFGTSILSELSETMSSYLIKARQNVGGKKKTSERQSELNNKLEKRNLLDEEINKYHFDYVELEKYKDEIERRRTNLMDDLARLGGGGGDLSKTEIEYVKAEKELFDSEIVLSEYIRCMGFPLGVSRLVPAMLHRLKSEELRESWESLRLGTINNKDRVLEIAMPEPPEKDFLLGGLSVEVREKVKTRFGDALESIYNPPPPDCASEYIFGHIKGESRSRALSRLIDTQSISGPKIKDAAKKVREARERFDEAKTKREKIKNLPSETLKIKAELDKINETIQSLVRKLGLAEATIKKLKADHRILCEEIGIIQDELARLGPEQKRIAIAERVSFSLSEILEKIKPKTTERLEEYVTKHFINIADPRFKDGKVLLPSDSPPEFEWKDGTKRLLESISGFEKRAFGIAFSLALADITKRRIPLVIDTPLGNADSEYRPRTLSTLTRFDTDQIIILTHDEEVTPKLFALIRNSIQQYFLISFKGREKGSFVYPNKFFDLGKAL